MGSWYTMRILPYRTLDNVIEGAVLTFVDITEMKKARDELERAKNYTVCSPRAPQTGYVSSTAMKLTVL